MSSLLKRKHVLAALKSSGGATYQSTIVADGAIAYWPLDDPSGTTARDLVGTRHGTISGGVTLNQAGVNGSKCMVFPNDGLGKIAPPPFPTLAGAFTLEVWAAPSITGTAGTYRILLTKMLANDGDWSFWIINNASNLHFSYFSGAQQTYINPVTLDAGVWSHYVLVGGSGQVTLYVNGVARAPQSFALSGLPSGTTSGIGYDPQPGAETWGWRGKMQDCAIYNRALTPAEIQSHYTKRLA